MVSNGPKWVNFTKVKMANEIVISFILIFLNLKLGSVPRSPRTPTTRKPSPTRFGPNRPAAAIGGKSFWGFLMFMMILEAILFLVRRTSGNLFVVRRTTPTTHRERRK